MSIDEDEKRKIMTTKPPSFTMKTLRPLANLIARYTSPAQILSILKSFGFKEIGSSPVEAEAALLRTFELLREEENDEDIRKIIESLLTLYARLIDEKLHNKGLIGPVREILRSGHFNLGYHVIKKEYLLLPFEGPVHGIVMRAEGSSEKDFQDEKREVRRTPENEGTLLEFTLSKAGFLSRRNPLQGDRPYSMEQGSRRHSVIKALVSSKSDKYIPTPDLAETANCNESEFRKTCGELRKQIGKHFTGVKKLDVIDSKSKSGYRINPKARIVELP